MSYHPRTEKIVQILCNKTNNSNPMFFRIVMAYYYGLIAGHMNASIKGWGNGLIPINTYAINLSPSGTGKGFSTSMIEKDLLGLFQTKFLDDTFLRIAQANIESLALRRNTKNMTDTEDELARLNKEFTNLGSLLFNFDSATTPALKQLRHKLLLANCGAINLQIDEIGANLISQTDILNTFLELYDKGLLKEKLIKSGADNIRYERIEGATPTNMLLFGTPHSLLDGAKTENQFFDMLRMGYARRCLFGYSVKNTKTTVITAEQMLANMLDTNAVDEIENFSHDIFMLGHATNTHKKIRIEVAETLKLIQYRIDCENKARELPETQDILKTELDHRYFKALKLAGAYAFIDGAKTIDSKHIDYAIQLVEDSGKDLEVLLTPERPYMKLAKYLAEMPTEMTLADLDTDLPYFRGGKAQKDELINMSIAYGYKNNIVIKRNFENGILFLEGETLEKTNLDKMIISVSDEITENYQNQIITWEDISELGTVDNMHWINHHLTDGYRNEENAQEGFNILVLDIDNGFPIESVEVLLEEYTYFLYSTKRHTDSNHRYRILLPINYTLKLDKDDYKEFMSNIFSVLPFDADESCNHRSKKWLTCDAKETRTNEGKILDILPYIPRTSKNEEFNQQFKEYGSIEPLQRWFLNNIGDGNRNNQLHRYGRILAEKGWSLNDIRTSILELNNQIASKLSEEEIDQTIMKTIARNI